VRCCGACRASVRTEKQVGMADGAGEAREDYRPELCHVPEEEEIGVEATVSSHSFDSACSPEAHRKSMGSDGSISVDWTLNLKQVLTNDMRARNLGKVEDELQRERNSSRSVNIRSQIGRIQKFIHPRDGRPWVHSNFANCFFGGIIIINAIFIGFETDYNRPEDDDGFVLTSWFFMESTFLVIFTMELLLRFHADGLSLLCDFWGIFDLLIVLLGVVDTWLLPACFAGSSLSEVGRLSMFRLLRLVRIVRVLRILRLLRFVRELLLLVRGIAGALRALGWSFLMMCIVLYISSVFATEIMREQFQLLDNDAVQDPEGDLALIHSWFGSIGTSFLTLSQLMTLEGWPSVVRKTAMEHNKHWLLCFFLPFICCTNFALLNVVTALMVEKVFEFAHDEVMHEAKRKLKERKAAIHKILKLFSSLDEDNDGKLNLQQVMDAADNPSAMKQFQELGIAKHDIDSLFLCLDVDGKGELTVAEFVEGCLRMHGPANSKDLLRIQYDVHRTWKALDVKRLTRYLEWSMRCLQNDSMQPPDDGSRSKGRSRTQPPALAEPLRTPPPRGPAAAEAEPFSQRQGQSRSLTLPSLTASMGSAPSSSSAGGGGAAVPAHGHSPEVRDGPEGSGSSNEDAVNLALPPEAQGLLEEVLSEQQQTRQLLEVLGDEMRDLRARIHCSSSRSLPLVQPPRDGAAPSEGPATLQHLQRQQSWGSSENVSARPSAAERLAAKSSLAAAGKPSTSKDAAGWLAAPTQGQEHGRRPSRLQVPRNERRKSSFDSVEATVAAVKISQTLVTAASEARRRRSTVAEGAGLPSGWSAGSDGQAFIGVVPGSVGPSDSA